MRQHDDLRQRQLASLYHVTMRQHDDLRQHQLASLYHVTMRQHDDLRQHQLASLYHEKCLTAQQYLMVYLSTNIILE